ncbi:hypothetical protein Acr_08g0011270 [Actinidia rufa]|uniref:Uncharacterized protein n=1 Tax=Actinidia rufa TaxID=165716 RepID=A0A7J0F202_9ERIC|nr:hypothetical protein Acr_08g0011270 [Actinidia rufa]
MVCATLGEREGAAMDGEGGSNGGSGMEGVGGGKGKEMGAVVEVEGEGMEGVGGGKGKEMEAVVEVEGEGGGWKDIKDCTFKVQFIWPAHTPMGKLDSKLELNIQENGDIVTEKSKSSKQSVDESDSSERQKDIRIIEDSNLPPEAEVEIISSSGVQDYVEEDVAAVINNDTSSSRNDLTWVEENSDAPEG